MLGESVVMMVAKAGMREGLESTFPGIVGPRSVGWFGGKVEQGYFLGHS